MKKSNFFAMLERLRYIRRWGLKRIVIEEDVVQHSFAVACIAHALAVIARDIFGKPIDPNQVVTAALFHDASEIITGDLPSPIKYHSAHIRDAYKAIEENAERELLSQLPDELQPAYEPLLIHSKVEQEVARMIKAADIISALLKCHAELRAGNAEFTDATEDIEKRLQLITSPEVEYFLGTFVDSYNLTLDKLMQSKQSGN